MPEYQVIKYCYKNADISDEAISHVFKYISAFGNYRFMEDQDAPKIWRSDGNDFPDSAKIVFTEKAISDQPSFFDSEVNDKRLFSRVDPIERIFRKISLKIATGPYGGTEFKPVNGIDDSLGAIINSFYQQLESAGLVGADEDNISFWPDGHRFAVALSHDVDMVRRSLKGSIRLLFRKDVQGGVRGLLDALLSATGVTRNPYEGVPDWIALENNLGIKSTYFMFPGNRNNNNDPKYKLRDLDKSIRLIREAEFGLGLHTGIECHEGEKISESAEILGRFSKIALKGIRPHYLSASFPEYWRSAVESGFEYSSSLGFDNDIGFYEGIDLPFIPFDMERNEVINIVEIPIGIMDCGLLGDRGEKMYGAIDRGKDLIDKTKKSGGILVFDWHQRISYKRDYPGWIDTLVELLDFARNEGAVFITLEEAAGLLRNRISDNI